MRDPDELATAFEELRPYLRRLAYSSLGSLAEAEDIVQDAWLRLQRTEAEKPGDIRDLRGWLTTVVGRLSLTALGSARSRREQYVGPWLPEPVVEAARTATGSSLAGSNADDAGDPADRVTLDEQVSTALLIVLERLSPAERTAFVLHDVFGLGFDEVAEVVGRTPAAVRQLASRARRHVSDGTPRFPANRTEQEKIVTAFALAWRMGDVAALTRVLDPDVVFTADGGGKVVAATIPVAGAKQVAAAFAAFAAGIASRGHAPRAGLVLVNGRPGLVVDDGGAIGVLSFTTDSGRIVAIDVTRNPDKLELAGLSDEAFGLFDTEA